MKTTFKDWLVIREQQGSLVSGKVAPGDEDDNDNLVNQAKAAIASSIGQPGSNSTLRAQQIRRIAQGAARKKGVKLNSILKLAQTADDLSKMNASKMQKPNGLMK